MKMCGPYTGMTGIQSHVLSVDLCQDYWWTATLKSIDYNVAMTFILNNNNAFRLISPRGW